jgi:chromosome segregation ATPase
MDDVKRFNFFIGGLGQEGRNADFILASEFDVAKSELAALREESDGYKATLRFNEGKNYELQQRLTAAEQRNAELEAEVERLNRAKLSLKELAESRADNCSVYRQHLNQGLTMAEKVRDASPGMKRKYLSDLIVHLYQNSGAALKLTELGASE